MQEVPKAMEMMNRVLRCMREAVEDQLFLPQVFEIRRVLPDACWRLCRVRSVCRRC